MPTQQPEQTFTPNEVAALTGIAAHSIRRWSEYHSDHLSASANPGTSIARRFTGRDIEVLRHVDTLRRQGLTVPVINEQLKALTFAEVDTGDSEALQASTDAPNAIESAQPVMVAMLDVFATQNRRFEALEASMKKVEQAEHKLLRDAVFMFMAGSVVTVVLVLIVLVALSAYAR